MSTLREAAQQALEALENGKRVRSCEGGTKFQIPLEDNAITSLRAALAQQDEPVQEPVAWLIDYEDGEREVRFVAGTRGIQRTPLYAAPPQRKPLTEKEMYVVEEEARKNFRLSQKGPRGQQITYWDGLTPWLIRAVERAHGIKE